MKLRESKFSHECRNIQRYEIGALVTDHRIRQPNRYNLFASRCRSPHKRCRVLHFMDDGEQQHDIVGFKQPNRRSVGKVVQVCVIKRRVTALKVLPCMVYARTYSL